MDAIKEWRTILGAIVASIFWLARLEAKVGATIARAYQDRGANGARPTIAPACIGAGVFCRSSTDGNGACRSHTALFCHQTAPLLPTRR